MILIVEDDKSILEMVCLIVHNMGYQYDMAMSVQMAMYKMRAHPPSLILLDIKLRDEYATPILDYWRAHLPSVPLVVMTALTARDTEGIRKDFNLKYFLLKPFQIESLEELVENLSDKNCQTTV